MMQPGIRFGRKRGEKEKATAHAIQVNQHLQRLESMAAREWRRNRIRLIRGFIGPRTATRGMRFLKLSPEEKGQLQKMLAKAFASHQKKWNEKTRLALEKMDA